jgi:hypothetical protein
MWMVMLMMSQKLGWLAETGESWQSRRRMDGEEAAS